MSSDTAPVRHRIYKQEYGLKPKDSTKEGILSTNESNSKWPNAWPLKSFHPSFMKVPFFSRHAPAAVGEFLFRAP